MSDDLTWQIVKKTNRYLLRNGTGDRRYFSTEVTNATKLHSFKASGLANKKAVGVRAAGTNGVELVFKNSKFANAPKKSTYTVKLTKGARPTGKAIRGLTATSYYRPDMTKAVQAAASQLIRAQRA
eukprot:m.8781 g.8781  ORF g.8781 m.8781 type:complete len:126 (-) comp9278_c0_seq1:179-556(-)